MYVYISIYIHTYIILNNILIHIYHNAYILFFHLAIHIIDTDYIYLYIYIMLGLISQGVRILIALIITVEERGEENKGREGRRKNKRVGRGGHGEVLWHRLC